MTHPLRNLLDRKARQNAQNINATFVENLGGGWCSVILSDTGETVRARLATNAPIAAGQSVIVSRPDGSGRSRNTGYTVIQAANSSPDSAPPIEEVTQRVGASITSIDPNPAIMEGGETVAIVVRGIGFTTVPAFQTAPSYGSPDLTDDSAPVMTDTQIDLSVIADPAIVPGDYSLTIGTLRTEPTYFQVSEAPIPPLPRALFISGTRTSPLLTYLLQVDLDTLTLSETYLGSAPTSARGSGVLSDRDARRVYWLRGSTAANVFSDFYVINPISRIIENSVLGATPGVGFSSQLSFLHLASDPARLMTIEVLNTATPSLRGPYRFEIDGSGVTQIWSDTGTSSSVAGIAEDDARIYLAVGVTGVVTITALSKATSLPVATLAASPGANDIRRILPVRAWTGPDGEAFGAYTGRLVAVGGATIRFIDAGVSSLTASNTITHVGDVFGDVIQLGSKLYTLGLVSGNLYRLDPFSGAGTETLVGTLTSTFIGSYLATDGVDLYVVSATDFKARRIDPADASVLATGPALVTGSQLIGQLAVTRPL